MCQFQVICTAPDGRQWVLNNRGNWSYASLGEPVQPAFYTTRQAARQALNRAYKHREDQYEVVQVSGLSHA